MTHWTQLAAIAAPAAPVAAAIAARYLRLPQRRPAPVAAPIAHDEGDGYYVVTGLSDHITPGEQASLQFRRHPGRRKASGKPHAGRWPLDGVLPPGTLAIGNQQATVARIVEAIQGELDQYLSQQPAAPRSATTIPARIRRAAVAEVHCTLRTVQVQIRLARGTRPGEIDKLRRELVLAVSPIISTTSDSAEQIDGRIRVLQSIPGTSHVVIELPRQSDARIGLRAILESPELAAAHRSMSTVVPIGVDTAGRPLFADLATLPHLLVAGATGGGKSVWLHQMLATWHWLYSPSELRLLVIDAKMVEGTHYRQSPLLLPPVETGGDPVPSTPEGALAVLQYAVGQVEMRNALLADAGAQSLADYNRGRPADQRLPRIAIVYDEFGEHILSASKVVRSGIETHIARIGQLARASGIHLIAATQRPSVNVVTGLIKSQMPARIALAVQSGVDSQTILDAQGAERLPPMGAMIFARGSQLLRAQGGFISGTEVQAVVDAARGAVTESNDSD